MGAWQAFSEKGNVGRVVPIIQLQSRRLIIVGSVNMTFKELRKSKGVSQVELAERMGSMQSTISSWETGKTVPAIDTMYRAAQILGCTLAEVEACFTDMPNKFGALRARSGMSQTEFARVMHITQQTVSTWEHGVSVPDLTTVAAIADALDCSFVEVAECFVKVRK